MPLLSRASRKRIAEFDGRVDTALDRWRGRPVPDRLFYAASALGDHSVVWMLLGLLRGARSRHDWKAAVRVGTVLAGESALVNVGIKSLFHRRRPPWEVHRPLPLRRPRTSSFPSGHATSAFTAAGLLSDHDRWWPAYYAVAGVVAVSRVYVKIHHASDVVGGVAIGVVLGRLARRVAPLPPAGVPSR